MLDQPNDQSLTLADFAAYGEGADVEMFQMYREEEARQNLMAAGCSLCGVATVCTDGPVFTGVQVVSGGEWDDDADPEKMTILCIDCAKASGHDVVPGGTVYVPLG